MIDINPDPDDIDVIEILATNTDGDMTTDRAASWIRSALSDDTRDQVRFVKTGLDDADLVAQLKSPHEGYYSSVSVDIG